jgi:hypothetical protein
MDSTTAKLKPAAPNHIVATTIRIMPCTVTAVELPDAQIS